MSKTKTQISVVLFEVHQSQLRGDDSSPSTTAAPTPTASRIRSTAKTPLIVFCFFPIGQFQNKTRPRAAGWEHLKAQRATRPSHPFLPPSQSHKLTLMMPSSPKYLICVSMHALFPYFWKSKAVHQPQMNPRAEPLEVICILGSGGKCKEIRESPRQAHVCTSGHGEQSSSPHCTNK